MIYNIYKIASNKEVRTLPRLDRMTIYAQVQHASPSVNLYGLTFSKIDKLKEISMYVV
jgi:hypothetical protein